MNVRASLFLLLMYAAGLAALGFTLFGFATPAQAQDAFFEFSTFDEGREAARDRESMLLVYFYDPESGSADDYNHIWRDPLVTRFVDKLAVTVVISADSEAGAAFMERRRRGRRKPELRAPGIYFFAETGRSLGVLRGNLAGEEGIGQMMLMLGAADYARHENNDDRWRRARHW